MCSCKKEIVDKIKNILEKYENRIGTPWNLDGTENLEYNINLDYICCDLYDLIQEIE